MLLNCLLATVFAPVLVLAAPLESRQTDFFTPSAIWKYTINTGAISSTSTGLVSKSATNNGSDITTLLTFTYPPAVVGKKCQFAFYLDNTAVLSGSRKLDVYTSVNPAPGPTNSWGPGNQRNIQLGRLSPYLGGSATWDTTYSAYLTQKTDCKAPGTKEGYELVGVLDGDYVSWDPKVAGPRIVYS